MRYLVVIGLVLAVLTAAGCSNGMGKGTQVMAAPAPPPPPPPPPPMPVQSSGMGKGTAAAIAAPPPPPPPVATTDSSGMGKGTAMRIACRIAAVNRATHSFTCRLHRRHLMFDMTASSKITSGGKTMQFEDLHAGQDVQINYTQRTTRTVDSISVQN